MKHRLIADIEADMEGARRALRSGPKSATKLARFQRLYDEWRAATRLTDNSG